MNKNKSAGRSNALDLVHGSKGVPENLIRHYLNGTKRRVEQLVKEKSQLYQEAARCRSKLRKPRSRNDKDPEVARAAMGFASSRTDCKSAR